MGWSRILVGESWDDWSDGHRDLEVTHLDVIEARYDDVTPSVVERGEDATDDDEDRHSQHVARHQVHREKMEVLAHKKLERVDVDRVEVTARGGLLPMVMLVHQPVDRLLGCGRSSTGLVTVRHGEGRTNPPHHAPAHPPCDAARHGTACRRNRTPRRS